MKLQREGKTRGVLFGVAVGVAVCNLVVEVWVIIGVDVAVLTAEAVAVGVGVGEGVALGEAVMVADGDGVAGTAIGALSITETLAISKNSGSSASTLRKKKALVISSFGVKTAFEKPFSKIGFPRIVPLVNPSDAVSALFSL